ncbi:MAG: helix-turn-helix domain-containing protein [Lachnospiraceae bacterium]|nr:helix-turn-helix domain-containing protein [Lachnospiraceae bacterium]
MANDRNAGRKPKIDNDELNKIRKRIENGEKIISISKEYGVSRQALYKRLKETDAPTEAKIDYYVGDDLCSTIYVNTKSQKVRLVNYALALSKRAFGYNDNPGLKELQAFLEQRYMELQGADSPDSLLMVEQDRKIDVVEELLKAGSNTGISITEGASIPRFEFSKKDRIIARTDTDGYQMKAVTSDRRHFVKSQSVISGLKLRDWAVEVIASDICRQLGISCVIQRQCRFVYEGNTFNGVYSDNFELDGYTFVSFERLLETVQKTSKDDKFIRMDSLTKLRWCAEELAKIGNLSFNDTLKYMIDLAVIDCLVGNTDRHTRNFGLFYNVNTLSYEIPLIFDNGMGLFENDPYRDRYESYDAAMNNVYVAPYGEDPFDMIRMLDAEYNLKTMYPGIRNITYPDILSTPYALEYERRMKDIWQK